MFLKETQEKINMKISHHRRETGRGGEDPVGSGRLPSTPQTVKSPSGYIWTDAASQQNVHILVMEVHSCQTNEPARS